MQQLESIASFEALCDTMTCGVMVWDTHGQLCMATQGAQHLFGMRLAEMQGAMPTLAFTDANGVPLAWHDFPSQVAQRTGQPQRHVILGFTNHTGQPQWIQIDALPLYDATQQVIQVVTTLIDMTVWVTRLKDLGEWQARLFSLTKMTDNAIISLDKGGHIIFVNERAWQMFGYTKAELQGQSLMIVLAEHFALQCQQAMDSMTLHDHHGQTGQTFEGLGVGKDGIEFPILLTLALYETNGCYYYNTVIKDISERKQHESTLRLSEERYRMVISHAPIILFALDSVGTFTLSEGYSLAALGESPGGVVGYSVFDVYRDYPAMLQDIRRAMAGERLTATHQLGDLFFETQYIPLRDPNFQQIGVVGIATDISARVHAEEALQQHERLFRAMSEQTTDLIVLIDQEGICQYASPSYQSTMGYPPQTLVGRSAWARIHPDDRQQVLANFKALSRKPGTITRVEHRMLHANGGWITLESVGRNCFDDPAIAGIIVSARDITERVKMEEALRYQAHYDSVTGLPNRAFLLTCMAEMLQEAEITGEHIALLILDLDRFKEINETFGLPEGDRLLQGIGERLRAIIIAPGMVARLGGDEFAILLPRIDASETAAIATILQTTLEAPFTIAGYHLPMRASIGAVIYPVHGADTLTLLQHAEMAMYAAKRTHEGCVFYDGAYDEQHGPQRLALIGAIRHAIDNNEFMLYYQPQASLKSGLVSSVEALLRWNHPTFGFVPPDQFIPLAEQTGLIAPLTRWVIETAMQQCSQWLQANLNLAIAINLSTWNLRDKTLPDFIAGLLSRYALPPTLLLVEVTESAVMTDMERAMEILERISAMGLHVSIDDFGTGYSSLAYLKRLPVDELKIDRSFVQHMASNETDATIVRSTVAMAHSLGLRVVAEGVEDAATMELLTNYDCDIAQGYYLSRPVPAHELERWLQRSTIARLPQAS